MDPTLLEELKEQINAVLDAETVLYKVNYRVESIEQQGVSIKAFCPIHQETMIRSLIVDPNKRRFRCNYFNCPGNRGGTFLELYCLATGCSEEEGVRFWSEELGLGGQQMLVEDPSRVGGPELEEPVPHFAPEGQESQDAWVEDSGANLEELVDFDGASHSAEAAPDAGGEMAPLGETGGETRGSSQYEPAFNSAVGAFESNKYHSALELFQSALQAAGGPQQQLDCEIMLARCFIHLKNSEEALALLRAALKRPTVPDVSKKEILYRTAEAWECGEQTDKAIEVLRVLMEKFGPYRDVESWLERLQGRRKPARTERGDGRISFI